jgi:hypothetical protein
MRQTNRVNYASARHSIAEFALAMVTFRAGHTDRLAHIYST